MMGPFESRVEVMFVESNPQCALSQLYGGLPEVGGFGDFTEYEVGVQRIAEAAHCILGSAGKVWRGYVRGDVDPSWRVERGHFTEEMGIIDKSIQEYSKGLYRGRTFLESSYRFDSIASMKKNSPVLQARAIQKRRLLFRDKKKYDPKLFDIAWWAYTLVKDLADAVMESVKDAVEQPTRNAFQDPDVRISAKTLRMKIAEAYR